MEITNCLSCMMPLTPETSGVNTKYCKFCSGPDGSLHTKDHVRSGIAQFLKTVDPEISQQEAETRAAYYMKAMPAWADK